MRPAPPGAGSGSGGTIKVVPDALAVAGHTLSNKVGTPLMEMAAVVAGKGPVLAGAAGDPVLAQAAAVFIHTASRALHNGALVSEMLGPKLTASSSAYTTTDQHAMLIHLR